MTELVVKQAVEAAVWECPCGREPPKAGSRATPVRTLVSLREPRCPFCGRKFEDDFALAGRGAGA